MSEEATQEYVEEIISNLEEDDFDNIEFYVQLLEELSRRPMDLNRDDLSPLADAGLISNEQIIALDNHINKYGRLLAIYELQSIPSWDLRAINRIRPFIKANRDLDDVHLSPKDLLKASTLTLRSYLSRRFPESSGYNSAHDSIAPAYEGDPFRHYIRLRAQYQYRFSVGMTVEKDAGEALFSKSNNGYDYTSFHLYGQSVNRVIKLLALGDYKVNMGQGLIIHNGFGGNKSAYVTDVKKGGKLFRPHPSTYEVNYFRGGGIEVKLAKYWRLGGFYSNMLRDANIVTDSVGEDVEILEFTSLQTSGLHRTQNEIQDEKQIRYEAIGGRIGIEKRKFTVYFNLLHNKFNSLLARTTSPYNQYRFNGDKLLNTSVDYSLSLGPLHFFGESALSDNGAMAHIVGLKAGLSKKIKWVSVYRHYPRDYQSIQPKSFGESRDAYNESGFYNALDYTINAKFQLSGYADLWTNPWLRFNVDAPASGEEYVFKFRYYKKRKIEAYAQYKYEEKAVSVESTGGFTGIERRKRNQLRCHVNYNINRSLKWRSRAEYNRVEFEDHTSDGYLIYQDFIYKPLQFPLSFTTRYSFFSTDDYDSRIYAYENHLLYNYSLPGFSGTGHRFYINLRYKPIKPLTLELRFDQVSYTDRTIIGSGTATRQGNRVRQVAVQLQWVIN